MCQESAKGFIMLLFLAAAAYLIAVNKAVVRYINLISAVAQAMPNDRPLIITPIRGCLGNQASKTLTGNV